MPREVITERVEYMPPTELFAAVRAARIGLVEMIVAHRLGMLTPEQKAAWMRRLRQWASDLCEVEVALWCEGFRPPVLKVDEDPRGYVTAWWDFFQTIEPFIDPQTAADANLFDAVFATRQ